MTATTPAASDTVLPEFTGDDAECPKCANAGALTSYRPAAQRGEWDIYNGVTRRAPLPERLERECTRCGYLWDEALHPFPPVKLAPHADVPGRAHPPTPGTARVGQPYAPGDNRGDSTGDTVPAHGDSPADTPLTARRRAGTPVPGEDHGYALTCGDAVPARPGDSGDNVPGGVRARVRRGQVRQAISAAFGLLGQELQKGDRHAR
jgi:hypothetical protein